MARRDRQHRRGPDEPASLAVWEGPEVLSALLRAAGSPCDADEVARRFARAQAAGEDRSAVIPGLFDEEPRFAGPDQARRLYGNLFGLWARVASGRGPDEAGPELPPLPPPPLPERGAVPGDRMPPPLVEAVWKHLAALPEREARRARNRFEEAQPDLTAWLAEAELPESGAAAAVDLAFETWAMMDRAFGDRVGRADWAELRDLAAEPPPLEAEEPALAAYVAEQLDLLAGEDEAFGPAERAVVERVVAAAAAALRRALG